MTVTIKIRCDNAAFDPAGDEVARILRELAGKVEGLDMRSTTPDDYNRRLMDVNGNHVGQMKVTNR